MFSNPKNDDSVEIQWILWAGASGHTLSSSACTQCHLPVLLCPFGAGDGEQHTGAGVPPAKDGAPSSLSPFKPFVPPVLLYKVHKVFPFHLLLLGAGFFLFFPLCLL